MENDLELKDTNVSAEICFVGSLYKKPDLFVNYQPFMKSNYDFADPVTKFLYDSFEIYYLKFSQTVNETKVNVFMSQNEERLQTYKQYKGWKTIQRYMSLADETDIKNYYDTVKKYSLVREYGRCGYPVNKILRSKGFDTMTANDIYRVIRAKADKINTVINAGEEAVELTTQNSSQIDKYLEKPNFGLKFPWSLYNEFFLGMRETKVLFEGFLSNEGKTRKLVMLAAYIALVQHKDFFLMSNEMDEEDLRSCLITTVINNTEFQELHGVKINKPEKEIVLGVYHDNNGEVIRRKIDDCGVYIETNEEYIQRIKDTSDEYWNVKKVTDWIDSEDQEGKVLFKDVGDDYSPERIEFELRKAKLVHGIIYYGYDTLKGYNTDDWSQIKQFATKLKELTKELRMSGYAVFQLSDDTVFTDVFSLSSNNIANAKQIKHVADILNIGKKLQKEEYHKYLAVLDCDSWGEPIEEGLNLDKQYFCIKPDKNRAGSKDKIMLFEIDLNLNIWKNIGHIIKKPKSSD
ncbi:hypothetical protein [Clostridium sp. AF32-12BH]|uniref:hypothetical protein n=1 Tax=Clostridium sp. AF32-12BH TaxID=2292006 RepID=UPI000E4751BE|nr:hypothetical protein [Clostridium sp. AF32-12BH]RHP46921.1 hypothetical protein DWZ40_08425 [Clostridium sp. AF32-12BH]